jgi:hypothetical protein
MRKSGFFLSNSNRLVTNPAEAIVHVDMSFNHRQFILSLRLSVRWRL